MTQRFDAHTRTLSFLVAAIAVAVYLNALRNGFALDDNFIVQGNPRVHSPSSLADIVLTPYWAFAGAELGLYRPGIILLYAFQWMISDGAPWVFHAVNILLHAIATTLVFALLRRLAEPMPAFAGALIFAVHPVHTEAVANIVGQAELVAAVAVLAACVLHAARPPGVAVSWPRRIAMMALFGAALTTKESAVVLPALLVAVDLVQRRVRLTLRGAAAYADAMLMPVFLLAATLALYLIIRYDVMGGALIGVDAAPSMPYLREEYRVLNALRAFPEFIRLLLFPLDLAADYSPAALLPVDTVRPMVLLGALLLTGLTGLALLTPWLPRAGFPAAWFIISIITVSNLFFPIGVVIAERTLYLPSVAVSALIAFAWQALAPRMSTAGRRASVVALALVVLALGVRTWIRNPVWRGTETVWASMLHDQPGSYRTQWLTAIQLWQEKRMDEAEARFEFAYRLYQRDSQLLAEYGNFLIARGRFDEAIPLLERAYDMHPWILRNAVVLMHAYLADGRYDDAIRVAHFAREAGGNPLTALPVTGYAHQQSGNLDDAVAAWRVAVRYSPAAWRLRAHVARVTALAGLTDDALREVETARATARGDSAARPILDSVEAAIRSGCYERAAASAEPPLNQAAPLGAGCDVLGHWFDYILAAQNAKALQNAMPQSSEPVPGDSARAR